MRFFHRPFFCVIELMIELNDSFSYERLLACQGYSLIAGVDEAGRGPLAGPVIAGAVILPEDCDYHKFKDSKKLTPKRREQLYQELQSMQIPIGVGRAESEEIDRINILQASLLAMKRAIEALAPNPDYILVDGKFSADIKTEHENTAEPEADAKPCAAQ